MDRCKIIFNIQRMTTLYMLEEIIFDVLVIMLVRDIIIFHVKYNYTVDVVVHYVTNHYKLI